MTLQERYAIGLKNAGYKLLDGHLAKGRQHWVKGTAHLWLGRAGSVRIARGVGRLDFSIPLTERGKEEIVRWATNGYPTDPAVSAAG